MNWDLHYFPTYWAGKKLAYPEVPKEHAKFVQSQVIGNLVVLSGCQALDHDSIKVETSDFREQANWKRTVSNNRFSSRSTRLGPRWSKRAVRWTG